MNSPPPASASFPVPGGQKGSTTLLHEVLGTEPWASCMPSTPSVHCITCQHRSVPLSWFSHSLLQGFLFRSPGNLLALGSRWHSIPEEKQGSQKLSRRSLYSQQHALRSDTGHRKCHTRQPSSTVAWWAGCLTEMDGASWLRSGNQCFPVCSASKCITFPFLSDDGSINVAHTAPPG